MWQAIGREVLLVASTVLFLWVGYFLRGITKDSFMQARLLAIAAGMVSWLTAMFNLAIWSLKWAT